MSSKEWIEGNPRSQSDMCPSCGSRNISEDVMPVDAEEQEEADIIFEYYVCLDCGHEWIDLNRIQEDLEQIRKLKGSKNVASPIKNSRK